MALIYFYPRPSRYLLGHLGKYPKGDRHWLEFLMSRGLQLRAACSSAQPSSQACGQQRVRSLSSNLVRWGGTCCLLILPGFPSSGVALLTLRCRLGGWVPQAHHFPRAQKSEDLQGSRGSLQRTPSFPPHVSNAVFLRVGWVRPGRCLCWAQAW